MERAAAPLLSFGSPCEPTRVMWRVSGDCVIGWGGVFGLSAGWEMRAVVACVVLVVVVQVQGLIMIFEGLCSFGGVEIVPMSHEGHPVSGRAAEAARPSPGREGPLS